MFKKTSETPKFQKILKDLGLALNLGKEERVPLPLGALSRQIFTHLLSLGLGKKDAGVIFRVMEELVGIQIRF